MKKQFLLCSLLLAFCFTAFGQENERFKNKNKKSEEVVEEIEETEVEERGTSIRQRLGISDRLIFGGNFSVNFGTNRFIYIAPSVGYKINEKLTSGGGYIYQYAKFSEVFNVQTQTFQAFDFESTVHGPKFFTYYAPIDILYLGTQVEYLNHEVLRNFPSQETTNEWTPVLFLEVGYLQKIGSGMVQIGMRYNVLHDFDSPYNSALIPTIGIFL